jgi:hypothetical protein
MGMYTELNIGIEFKKETPKLVIETLLYMVGQRTELAPRPDHELFQTDRWEWMLRSEGSYYFDHKPTLFFDQDNLTNTWSLSFCTNLKNYCGEWEKFLNWISPYVDTHGYIGTYRYEEDRLPTLLIINDQVIRFLRLPEDTLDDTI